MKKTDLEWLIRAGNDAISGYLASVTPEEFITDIEDINKGEVKNAFIEIKAAADISKFEDYDDLLQALETIEQIAQGMIDNIN